MDYGLFIIGICSRCCCCCQSLRPFVSRGRHNRVERGLGDIAAPVSSHCCLSVASKRTNDKDKSDLQRQSRDNNDHFLLRKSIRDPKSFRFGDTFHLRDHLLRSAHRFIIVRGIKFARDIGTALFLELACGRRASFCQRPHYYADILTLCRRRQQNLRGSLSDGFFLSVFAVSIKVCSSTTLNLSSQIIDSEVDMGQQPVLVEVSCVLSPVRCLFSRPQCGSLSSRIVPRLL